MFKKYPLISRLSLFIVLPMCIGLLVAYWFLHASVANYEGKLFLSGLNQMVDISYDENGLAHVTAQDDRDAYFAQGYLHASERMWQMELQRRLVDGRLSEVFGQAAVGTDIWMRTLGLSEAAKQSVLNLSQPSLDALKAYAEGVNSWIKQAKVLPPEFIVLDIVPQPWRIEDSLAWQKAFALNLGKNMYDEINRMQALKVLNPHQLKAFYPFDPNNVFDGNDYNVNVQQSIKEDKQYKLANWSSIERSLNSYGIGERFSGSNGWVVNGQYSDSGFPILANDPHLGIQSPSLWYAMTLKGDKLNVRGMSVAGLPGIMLGRNNNVAWGVTSLIADQQDLYILDIPLDNNKIYLTDKGERPISYRKEIIQIRSQSPSVMYDPVPDLEIQVRTTELGPIVTDAIGEATVPMALKWAALEANDKSYQALFEIQYAQNWSQFRQSLSNLKAPGFYFLYADKNGNIGGQVAAAIPNRKTSLGILPQKAFDSENKWNGYIDYELLPSEYNPTRGYIASANDKIDNDHGYTISHEWAESYRKDRIAQVLSEKIQSGQKHSIESFQALQLDTVDISAQLLLPILLSESQQQHVLEHTPKALQSLMPEILLSLSQWDASYRESSFEATVYHYWLEHLGQSIFIHNIKAPWSASLESDLRSKLTPLVTATQIQKALQGELTGWCTFTLENQCQQIITHSLYQAIFRLQKDTRSSTFEDWQWGKLHYVSYEHQLFAQIKFLQPLFKQRLGISGSANTLRVANAVRDEESGFQQTFGVTFRQVFDLADEGGKYILDTGQSGHFMSDNYDNMMQAFQQGKLLSYEVKNDQQKTLKLIPKESQQ